MNEILCLLGIHKLTLRTNWLKTRKNSYFSTYRTVIKRRATDSDRWKSRGLWTCCLHIAYTITAIRTVHIYCWSWRVCCGKSCPCVRLMGRCWGTITLCCSSLIIIHNCWRKIQSFLLSFELFSGYKVLKILLKKLFSCMLSKFSKCWKRKFFFWKLAKLVLFNIGKSLIKI